MARTLKSDLLFKGDEPWYLRLKHPTEREFVIALAAIIFVFALLMAGTR